MIWLAGEGTARALVPSGAVAGRTVAALADIAVLPDDLWDEERLAIASAVASRRREFAAARYLARRALGRLGVAARAIPRRPDRAPVWPEGLVGSLSHCRHLAAAVVSARLRAVGVDVECCDRLEPKLFELLFTPAEAARAAGEPDVTALFGAKEAVFKAIHPLTGIRPEFREAEIDLAPGRFAVRYRGDNPAAAVMERIRGFWAADGGHVLTLAMLEP